MATSPHFPRSPSPYPPPLTRAPSSSTKRSSSEQSRATNDENTIVQDTTFDYIAAAEEGKMASRPGAPDRRNSLASLSVAHDRNDAYDDEPTWPKDPKAYLCALGGFFLMFNSWGLVNAYGTYSSYYGQHLMPEKTLLHFNLIGGTQSFVVLILSAVVGRFLDAGFQKTLICVGTFLVALGSFTLSLSNGRGDWNEGNYHLTWLTQGFISSLGMACFFVTSSQVAATWFRKKKGLAIGFVASGASIAGLIYPVMFRFLIIELKFPNTARCVAAVSTVTSILAILIARPNPDFGTRAPEKWSFSVFVDWKAFKNAGYAWFCAAICWMFFGFYAVFFNLEEWAADQGIGYKDNIEGSPGANRDFGYKTQSDDAVRTFFLLATMNGASTAGRLGSAYLCDHFGALNVHAVVTFIASLLVLINWTLANTVSKAFSFVTLFGIFSGAVIGLPPASVAYILGKDPEAQAKLGQWTGMMYSLSSFFALTGPVIAGYLISAFDSWLTVQMWSGACLVISSFCMLMAILYRAKAMKEEESMRKRMIRRLSSVVAAAPEDWTQKSQQPSTTASSVIEKDGSV